MGDKKIIIICGSKRYDNINFNNIVDGFDIIQRCNMNINKSGYGTRESDIQVLNIHANQNFKHADRMRSVYKNFASGDVIEAFIEYVRKAKTEYVSFPKNNTDRIQRFLNDNNIKFKMNLKKKELRGGFAYIPKAHDCKYEIYLIGFSLTKKQYTTHQVNFDENKLKVNDDIHDRDIEIELLKTLHNNNILDATLCAIVDEKDLTIDCSLISPKVESLLYILQIYNNMWLKNYKDFTNILDTNNINWEKDNDKIKLSI